MSDFPIINFFVPVNFYGYKEETCKRKHLSFCHDIILIVFHGHRYVYLSRNSTKDNGIFNLEQTIDVKLKHLILARVILN